MRLLQQRLFCKAVGSIFLRGSLDVDVGQRNSTTSHNGAGASSDTRKMESKLMRSACDGFCLAERVLFFNRTR